MWSGLDLSHARLEMKVLGCVSFPIYEFYVAIYVRKSRMCTYDYDGVSLMLAGGGED